MALTKDFKQMIMERAQKDDKFRIGLLTEALNCFLTGEPDVGRLMLRDYLNATGLVPELAQHMGVLEKSLRRMVGPKGNPTLKNFSDMLTFCINHERITFRVMLAEAPKSETYPQTEKGFLMDVPKEVMLMNDFRLRVSGGATLIKASKVAPEKTKIKVGRIIRK